MHAKQTLFRQFIVGALALDAELGLGPEVWEMDGELVIRARHQLTSSGIAVTRTLGGSP